MIALPGLLAGLVNALRKPQDISWAMHLPGIAGSGSRQLGQIFLTLAFLAYDAIISVDAIGKTLLRLLVTHKRLLEWQTSSDSERTARTDLAGFYATMWIAPGLALARRDCSGRPRRCPRVARRLMSSATALATPCSSIRNLASLRVVGVCGDFGGQRGTRRKRLAGFLSLRRAHAICGTGARVTTWPLPAAASRKRSNCRRT